jgi:predicted phage terminase large subunit-like protein
MVDVDYGRFSIMRIMEGIMKFARKYPRGLLKLIEDKANGPSVIQMLRTKVPGLVAVPATKSKTERINAVLPLFEAGNVYIPDKIEVSPGVFVNCEWAEMIIDEAAKFKPNKDNKLDNNVDALSQALNRFMYAFVPQSEGESMVVNGFTTEEELRTRRPGARAAGPSRWGGDR